MKIADENWSLHEVDVMKGCSREDVARRAYELFLSRGGQHGFDVADWLQAEHQLSSNGQAEHQPSTNGQAEHQPSTNGQAEHQPSTNGSHHAPVRATTTKARAPRTKKSR
jgi:hypothetical protein